MRQDNLVVIQGEDWAVTWPVLDVNGAPLNVTSGYTVRAQVRRYTTSSTVLHQWTGPSVTAELTGTSVTLHIPATTSDAWDSSWGGVYDVELVETATGRVSRIAKGSIQLDANVTR